MKVNDKGKYYCRFVPFNTRTLTSLINKTIHYSTVYDFNDFSEMRYFGANEDHAQFVREYIGDRNNLYKILPNLRKNHLFTGDIESLISKAINNSNNSKYNLGESGHILEAIIFSNIGIFCLSDIDVFNPENGGDVAQLMYAHYGDSLKGLCLVYTYQSKPKSTLTLHQMTYNNEKYKNGVLYKRNSIANWTNGTYNDDMDNFLVKASIWEYEKEWRIFNTPGIHRLPPELILKAILYTPRLDKTNLDTIKNIKLGDVELIRITPSISKYQFEIRKSNEDKHNINDYFK